MWYYSVMEHVVNKLIKKKLYFTDVIEKNVNIFC